MVMILLTICAKSFSNTKFVVGGIGYEVRYDNVSVSVIPLTDSYYSGDIVIPEVVTYNNKKYIVNYVGFRGFQRLPQSEVDNIAFHYFLYYALLH